MSRVLGCAAEPIFVTVKELLGHEKLKRRLSPRKPRVEDMLAMVEQLNRKRKHLPVLVAIGSRLQERLIPLFEVLFSIPAYFFVRTDSRVTDI